MHPQKVEVDEPRVDVEPRALVLREVAVVEAAVHEVHAALGVDGTRPELPLHPEQLAVGVERAGERARARHARVVVAAAPGRDARVHVAVAGVEVELALELGHDPLARLHGERGLRRVAAVPRGKQVAVRLARHAVGVPEAVDGGEVGIVVVGSVEVAERVDHVAREVKRARVAALLRRRARAEREALVAVAHAHLVVADEHHLARRRTRSRRSTRTARSTGCARRPSSRGSARRRARSSTRRTGRACRTARTRSTASSP